MTKKRSRILSLFLAVAMLVSVFSVAIPTLTAVAEEVESLLQSPDPGVTTSCTDITWVAAGKNSYAPGKEIVAATPSGIPMIYDRTSDESYAGETPSSTLITATFTNAPDVTPTLKCTSGGSNMVFTAASYNSSTKTYSWSVVSGQATAETVLEFSITYPFNGRNYTNKVYSYVRGIAQPAGIYMLQTLKTCQVDMSNPSSWINVGDWDSYLTSSKTYSVDYITRILGKNTYYSLGSFAESLYELFRGTYNPSGRSASQDSSASYNVAGSIQNLTISGKTGIKVQYMTAKPYVHVYIDTSTASTLADMNLRVVSDCLGAHGDNAYGVEMIQNRFTSGNASSTDGIGSYDMPNGASGTLGFSGMGETFVTGTHEVGYLRGSVTSGEYTMFTRAAAVNSDRDVWLFAGGAIGIVLHSVDKSTLRNTITKILAGNLYEDSDPYNVFRCKNKGVNPQQWQFKNNWSEYSSAMRDAAGILIKPNATQDEINGANEALINAYDNLQLKPADYSIYNEYKDLADAAIAQETSFYSEYGEHWFYTDTLENLQTALEAVNESCHILYQPQVDAWTDALIEAYEALRVLPADYTSLNEVVAQANTLLDQKLEDGSSIYVNSSDLATAVASVRYDLTKADQETIVIYEQNIRDAISALTIRSADYTEINLLKSQAESLKRSNYTNYNTTVIPVLKDISKRANLKITQQDIVDADAATLRAAINGLIPKDADYTELEALLAEAAALVREYYYPESLEAIDAAVAATEGYRQINILNQTRIDSMAANLQTALAEKQMYPADYSEVDRAIEYWETTFTESELEKLQESSIQAVNVARSAVDRSLKIDEQARVDEWALRLWNAINNVEYLGADYAKVEAAIAKVDTLDRTYYADFSGVDNAIAAVNWQLGLNRQAEVDAMADDIYDAIDQLVPGPADYSRVNLAISRFEALNKNYYTRESVAAVEELINNINWDLNKDNQATVITYAFDINEAIFNLVEADADYTELRRVIFNIPSDLSSYYTKESIDELYAITDSIDWNLKARNQSTVDGYVASINETLANLEYLPGDYTEVDRQIAIGRRMIQNGVLQPDGTYFEISAQSAADFEEFVAGLNRSYRIIDVEEIQAVADSVTAKYQSFTFAESIHRAVIKLSTDKTITYPGDVVTVSVSVKTDYPVAAAAIPVLYNSEYYEIVGSGASAFTFSDIPYINGSSVSGNTNSPDKGYPASYSASDKATWNYAYITVAPTSVKGGTAVTLDPEQVIATFQLRVKDTLEVGNDPIDSRIWVDSAFLKTSANKGGKLYIGRYTTGRVDTNIAGYGQTINVSAATKTVTIYDENAPANLTELTAAIARQTAYDASFYTDESYEVYSAAIAAGQDIVDNAANYTIKEQSTVDEAVANIKDAYAALRLKDADVSLLETAVLRTPEYTQDKYTEESYLVFTNAISAAEAILEEEGLTIADNARITAAAQAIEDAISDLVLKDCSYMNDLYEIIDTFPMFEETEYTAEALDGYYDAFDACDAFLAEDKTILDDDEALELVNDFYDKYVALEKTALAKAIADCTTEYDSSCYTEESYAAYQTALNSSTSLYDTVSTKEDVALIQDSVQTLKSRFAALVINPFAYEDEVWAALDLFPQDEEHTVAESLDAYYEAYDALDIFANEKSGSWTALDNAEALALIQALRNAYDNLVIESADVSELMAAITNAPAYAEAMYTEESYSVYAQAVAAGRLLTNATYDRQDEVDEATQAIVDAYDALELKPFSKLAAVNEALEAQPSLEQNEYIPSYWAAYSDALADLEAIVENAATLTILDDQDAQDKIDAYNAALADLEENGVIPDADYSAVLAAVSAANAKLAEMQATGNELVQSTVDALNTAINNVDYSLDGLSQDTIDAYATAINAAAGALEYVPKFVIGSEDVTVDNGFVFGLENIASANDITAVFSTIGDASVEIEETANGYGTGTVIKLVDNKTSEVLQSLTVVVTGDANGDGFVDSFDVAFISELINNFEDPSDEATMLALDIVSDGWIDAIDYAYVLYMANYE
ncbi:MAG: hypothetical protein IJS17_00545 [Clostridia bacterium]|nr:hypothetical protein [Clostridia bacterium]